MHPAGPGLCAAARQPLCPIPTVPAWPGQGPGCGTTTITNDSRAHHTPYWLPHPSGLQDASPGALESSPDAAPRGGVGVGGVTRPARGRIGKSNQVPFGTLPLGPLLGLVLGLSPASVGDQQLPGSHAPPPLPLTQGALGCTPVKPAHIRPCRHQALLSGPPGVQVTGLVSSISAGMNEVPAHRPRTVTMLALSVRRPEVVSRKEDVH